MLGLLLLLLLRAPSGVAFQPPLVEPRRVTPQCAGKKSDDRFFTTDLSSSKSTTMPRDLPIAPPPGEDDLGSDFLVDGLEDWGVVGRPEEEQTNLLADLDIEAMRAEVEVRDWPLSLREICEKEREEHKKNYARHANDSGSPEVQVALFSARIKHVTQHVIDNPKDFASRRGLLALVSKRRRLLNYYFKKKPQAAEQLVKDLGIRFRFRAKIPSRDEKYREFTIRANRKKK